MADAEISVRRATPADRPAVFVLAGRALGWEAGPATERHFAWKHDENPFGPSPMWIAEVDGRPAGFRTFVRWELVAPDGTVHRVVRAVDTATDPDFQGRGVFTALTLAALDELRADGVAFVFNTPNDQSRPGYLKMGWEVVGTLPVGVRPTGPRGLVRAVRARTPADRGALATPGGRAAGPLLADPTVADALLAVGTPTPGWHTHRTAAYLAWRYGPAALHYRVVTASDDPAEGAAVVHLRRRGPAVEAVVADLFVPDRRAARSVLRAVVARGGADYLIRIRAAADRRVAHGFVPVPGTGPTLTVRAVTTAPPTDLATWALTLGDVEIF